MADNKKKKTDFSTGLQAAAEKLKPRDLRKDVLTITVGGVPTPIARGDMSDADWANVVKQSVKEATPGEFKNPYPEKAEVTVDTPSVPEGEVAKLSEEDAPDPDPGGEEVEDVKKSIDWPRLMSLGQNLDQLDKSLVSDEEKGHLKGMSEWSRAEFLRERMRKHGYEVPQTTAEAEKASLKKESTVEAPPEKPTEKQGGQGYKGNQPRSDTVGSAEPGMSVRGQMERLAMGATPKPIVEQAREDRAAAEAANPTFTKDEQRAIGDANVAQGSWRNAASDPLGPPADPASSNMNVLEGMRRDANTLVRDAPGKLLDAPGKVIKGAVNTFMPDATGPAPSLADPLDAPQVQGAIPAPPALGAIPPDPGMAGPSPLPGVGPGGSASMSASFSGGGGFTPAKVDPKAIELQQQAQEHAMAAQLAAQDRIDKEAENQKSITSKAAEIELHDRQQADELGALAIEAQQNAVTKAESWSAARAQASQAARDAAANPTDPNRYWNSRDDGQRAMAVAAGALYGFLGQGMQWLQRIDGLVDADNRLQASDRASKVEGLKGYAAEMGAQADDAMKYGLTRAQSQILARTQKLEGIRSQLDILAMRQTNSMNAMKGAEMSAQLGQHIDQIANSGLQLAQQRAQLENAAKADNARLAMQSRALAAKAAAKGKDGKRPPGVRVELARIEAGLQAVKEARDAVGKGVKFTDQMSLNLGDALRAMGASGVANFVTPDVSGRAATADTAQENVLKSVKGENLLEADLARALPRFKRPGLAAENNAWLDAQEKILKAKQHNLLTNAGEDEMSGTPLPEEGDFGFEAVQ